MPAKHLVQLAYNENRTDTNDLLVLDKSCYQRNAVVQPLAARLGHHAVVPAFALSRPEPHQSAGETTHFLAPRKRGRPLVCSFVERVTYSLSLRHPDYSAVIGAFPVPFSGGVRMATKFKSRARRSRRFASDFVRRR